MGQKINEAEVTSSTGDPTPGNNTATEDTTVQPASNLSLTKEAPEQVADESLFTYTLNVENNGPSPAAGVRVTDELPDGVEFVRDGTDDRCAFNPEDDTVTCGQTPPLASGEQSTFEIRVRAKAAGERVENTAAVEAQPTDPSGGNNRDSATTRIQAQADLSIDKRAPGRATDESRFTYTLIVKNNGPSSAESVRITDKLPGGVQFLSASRGCNKQGGTVRCGPFSLASGATKQVKINVRAKTPGRKVNRASVSGAGDPNGGNNRAAAATVVRPRPAPAARPTPAPEACKPGRPGKTIIGTPGNDVLRGTSGNDTILGYGGNDRIVGGNGKDTIIGGGGSDTISGGPCSDSIKANSGNNRVYGGGGNDAMDGGRGRDLLVGGSGRDALVGVGGRDRLIARDGQKDAVNGGSGRDVCRTDGNDSKTSCP